MSTYFTTTGLKVSDGTDADAPDLNNFVDETDSAFTEVEQDILSVSNKAFQYAETAPFTQVELGTYSAKHYSKLAEEWAVGTPVDDTGTPTGDQSSKDEALDSAASAASADGFAANADAYAISALGSKNAAAISEAKAEEWAISPALVESPDKYSAKYSANLAAGSASLAAGSASTSAQDALDTGVDLGLTNADVLLTGIDVGLTNADVVLTHDDVLITYADAAATALSEFHAGGFASQASDYNTSAGLYSLASQGYAGEASASATLALGYKNDAASLVAWGNLASLNELVGSLVTTDLFIYDTSKDSDGGAWRKRCQHLSWYNETLNTATRGSTREFPALAGIVVTAATLYIYDLTDPDVPMWKIFTAGSGGFTTGTSLYGDGTSAMTSAAMMNGKLAVGSAVDGFISILDFLKDTAETVTDVSGPHIFNSDLAGCNDAVGHTLRTNSDRYIVGSGIKQVAMTVIPEAPYDVQTGLPVPTIGLTTEDGASFMDGPAGVDTTFDITYDGGSGLHTMDGIEFPERGGVILEAVGYSEAFGQFYGYNSIPSADVATQPERLYAPTAFTPTPNMYLSVYTTSIIHNITDQGIGMRDRAVFLHENWIDPSNGMQAQVAPTYATGWIHGTPRGVFFCDTTVGSVGTDITTNKVLNGDFTTNTNGWTPVASALSVVGGELQIQNDPTVNPGYAHQLITTVAGQVYKLRFTVTNGTSATNKVNVGNAAIGATTYYSVTDHADATYEISFQAFSNVTYITLYTGSSTSGQTCLFDDIELTVNQNRIVSGEFGSAYGWTLGTWTIAGGVASAAAGITDNLSQVADIVVGQDYLVRYTLSSVTGGSFIPRIGFPGVGLTRTTNGTFEEVITCDTNTTVYLSATGFTGNVDNLSIRKMTDVQIVTDRSWNQTPMSIIGELDTAVVNTGAELTALEGFDDLNYAFQGYNSNMDVGTGNFYFMTWFKQDALNQGHLYKRSDAAGAGNVVYAFTAVDGTVHVKASDGDEIVSLATKVGQWHQVIHTRVGTDEQFYLDGKLVNTQTNAGSITNTEGHLYVGNTNSLDDAHNGPISMLRFGSTGISGDQASKMYNDEKYMFLENADCTLGGASILIKDISYDRYTKEYSILTESGISKFQGLRRLLYDGYFDTSGGASPAVGPFLKVASARGKVLLSDSTRVKYSSPVYNLRAELDSKNEELAKAGLTALTTAGSGHTAVELPVGYYPVTLYDAGVFETFTVTWDGFNYYANITASTGAVTIMARRV